MEHGSGGMEHGSSGMEHGSGGMEHGSGGMEHGSSGMESGHGHGSGGMESGHGSGGMESGSGHGSGSGGETPIEVPVGSGSGGEIPIELPSTESPLEIIEDGEQPLELIEEEGEQPLELIEEEGEAPVEIPEDECCSEKTVGGIHYYLVGTGETEVYNCLDNCIYHSANPRDVWQYCFRPGRQPVQCNDATVTPSAGHHHPTTDHWGHWGTSIGHPMMDHGGHGMGN